jgi:hypothetical protein
MSYADNQAAIQKLGNGELHGVSSCDIVSEGFDVPVVTAAILLRPTKSLGLHLQQIGRVLRPAPGKERAIVIDHVGNVAHCKANRWSLMHGKAEDNRVWSLDGKEKEKREAPVRRCEACFAIVPAAAEVCPECGHEREQGVRGEVKQLDGDLEELPECMPTEERGIAKRFFNMLEDNPELDAAELAESLLPPVPQTCHQMQLVYEIRREVVRWLGLYQLDGRKKRHWDLFRAELKAYMRRVNGALCAAAESLSDFEAIAELNGYKPGWAYFRHQQKLSHVRS